MFFLPFLYCLFPFSIFYCPSFSSFFFTFVFVYVFRLMWVSCLAYPNLLRTKKAWLLLLIIIRKNYDTTSNTSTTKPNYQCPKYNKYFLSMVCILQIIPFFFALVSAHVVSSLAYPNLLGTKRFCCCCCAYSKQQKTTKGHNTHNRSICNSMILCKFARLLHSKNIHSINLHKILNDVSIH
jgi:hypothetical protein